MCGNELDVVFADEGPDGKFGTLSDSTSKEDGKCSARRSKSCDSDFVSKRQDHPLVRVRDLLFILY